MSGFYNDDLEAEMTGMKPDRPNSSIRNVNIQSILENNFFEF